MFVLADRVQETTTTTGTGTLTLAGASAQYQSFSNGIGANNVTFYGLIDGNGAAWETGIGTVGSGGTTLARTTVLESSNSNAAITLSSGTHTVYCNQPATQVARTTPNVPIASSFSWINQQGATLTNYTNGPLVYQQTTTTGGSSELNLATLAASGSFTLTCQFSWLIANDTYVIIGVTDGTKILGTLLAQNNGGSVSSPLVQIQPLSYTSYSASDTQIANFIASLPNPCWMQFAYDSSTPSVNFAYSLDGFNWINIYSASGSLFLTPNAICFGGVWNNNISTNTPEVLSFNYLVIA